ncbi:DUF4919 domain-containing protein [candidate division KSB1 bacterium]
MRKIFSNMTLIFLLFTYLSGNAQISPPDFVRIKEEIIDVNSRFYYPPLYQRYLNNDTTLTVDEYMFIYYGHIFHYNYNPFYVSPYADSMDAYLKKENLSRNDFQMIVKYGKKVLNENPFSIKHMNYLGYAYTNIGNSKMAKLMAFKSNMLVTTIFRTGDGLSEETAWWIVFVSHEYDILKTLRFEFAGVHQLTKNKCHYLSIKPNDGGLKGVFYNVSKIIEFEEEKKKGK